MRICRGALKTTPTAALQAEMGEMPLDTRRLQLSLTYWVQGHSQDHPTQLTLKPWEKEKRNSKSFGWTMTQKAIEIEIAQLNISPTVPLPVIPPWMLPNATVDFTLLEKKKKRELI